VRRRSDLPAEHQHLTVPRPLDPPSPVNAWNRLIRRQVSRWPVRHDSCVMCLPKRSCRPRRAHASAHLALSPTHSFSPICRRKAPS
ncbi:hypothetical protein B0H34DRAFT_724156, partial [Crassisporium funariophilum]